MTDHPGLDKTLANTATIRQRLRRLRLLKCCAVPCAPPVVAVAGAGCRLLHRQDEIGNARRDLSAETRAVEHAVMADTRLQPVRLPVRWNIGAQCVRRFG